MPIFNTFVRDFEKSATQVWQSDFVKLLILFLTLNCIFILKYETQGIIIAY